MCLLSDPRLRLPNVIVILMKTLRSVLARPKSPSIVKLMAPHLWMMREHHHRDDDPHQQQPSLHATVLTLIS